MPYLLSRSHFLSEDSLYNFTLRFSSTDSTVLWMPVKVIYCPSKITKVIGAQN
ncbi:hypothetical protein KR51_00016350 [Rubidibacter lacunae KORDI 51-2]|uniref:Uncharacterized protein n=1 Tax=Rubidibacter lacunae KORDI 51-2 TaxID=582515 RepID=U5DB63_9CHRO|nr:hypothetical protein KR51_00016350 [Rubidibacter lacunae KORDI 51-2]